jgi:hypothetical protein
MWFHQSLAVRPSQAAGSNSLLIFGRSVTPLPVRLLPYAGLETLTA